MKFDVMQLLKLQQDGELDNCVWQLVLAAAGLVDAMKTISDERFTESEHVAFDIAIGQVIRALRPFEKTDESPTS